MSARWEHTTAHNSVPILLVDSGVTAIQATSSTPMRSTAQV